MTGRLVVCATPIGNLGDASPRLAEALRNADVIYAEDTRRSRVLLTALDIERPLRSYFVGNEQQRSEELASHGPGSPGSPVQVGQPAPAFEQYALDDSLQALEDLAKEALQ